jgi:hypothetical protein
LSSKLFFGGGGGGGGGCGGGEGDKGGGFTALLRTDSTLGFVPVGVFVGSGSCDGLGTKKLPSNRCQQYSATRYAASRAT